jgi:hypothetical protein
MIYHGVITFMTMYHQYVETDPSIHEHPIFPLGPNTSRDRPW